MPTTHRPAESAAASRHGVADSDQPDFSVNDTTGLVTAADFELVGNDTSGWVLQTRTGVTFDMPTNASRTITVTVNGTLAIHVRPDETISNTVQARFTSLDGNPGTISSFNANSTERTGANGHGGGTEQLRQQRLSPCLDIHDPTPVKSLKTSSEVNQWLSPGHRGILSATA